MVDDALDYHQEAFSAPAVQSAAATAARASGASPALPRLGQISFINCLPVALPIERGAVPVSAQVVYGSPAELNSLMADGGIEVSAMSSFFYLQHGRLDLVPGLSISCDGAVGSVLFFSKLPFNQLSGKRIAVPASSATSVNLLRLLLLEEAGVSVDVVVQAEPSPEAAHVDGALVIGDLALRKDADWACRYWRADLGQWWLNRTGLPMVFGLWAARSDWATAHPDRFQHISHSLAEAVSLGLGRLFAAVVCEAQSRTHLQSSSLQSYFQRQLNYELSPGHMAGLQHFCQLCRHYRLL